MDIRSIQDSIYNLLDRSTDTLPNPEKLKDYGERIISGTVDSLSARDSGRDLSKLWFSDLGETCPRKVWYKFHSSDDGEALGGHVLFKFMYGNVLEEMALYLAELAGHEVSHRQHRVTHVTDAGTQLSGRIDAVIDGYLVDVKSTSSFGFSKYSKEGITPETDTFGYIHQLSGYYHFSDFKDDLKGCGFLFIDKQNGHVKFVEVDPLPLSKLESDLEGYEEVLAMLSAEGLPRQPTKLEKNGNRALSTKCSYCQFKNKCWSRSEGNDTNLRTFIYSNGPKFLTQVRSLPKVPEI